VHPKLERDSKGKLLAGNCVRIFNRRYAFPDGADTIALQEDASEFGDNVENQKGSGAQGRHNPTRRYQLLSRGSSASRRAAY